MRKFFFFVLAGCLLFGAFMGVQYYQRIWAPITQTGEDGFFLYIPTGADFNQVKDSLYANNIIISKSAFEWLAAKKNYTNHIKPGKYLINNKMTNTELINRLRSGKQSPVRLIFNSIRTKEQFAARISQQLEVDSLQLLALLNDRNFLKEKGFNPDNVLVMFIPNTYEFFWNTHPKNFIDRMKTEYERFWSDDRITKAKSLGLSPIQVSILASIVEQETVKDDEKPVVAGVYMNRLNKDMALEADPTLIFALGDFNIKRVLNKDREIESPYNTYKHKGLPPGPICMPSKSSITSVLDYERHQYLFFCAREDLSGYHNFAKTLAQHMQNARIYQETLNHMNIKR